MEKSLNMFKGLQNSLKNLIYTTKNFVSPNSYTVAAKSYLDMDVMGVSLKGGTTRRGK